MALQNSNFMIRLSDNVLMVNDMAGLVSRLRRRIPGFASVGVLTDRNVEATVIEQTGLLQKISSSAHMSVVKPGEASKSLTVVEQLSQEWLEAGMDRNSLIINIGGGVVSDLGGFAASIFKRGIRFINIPTTLLSMIDASVGGKTGVNLGGAKNQIGTFSRADEVIIWTGFLKWLPSRELKSGFAECLKHAFLQGGEALRLVNHGLPADPATSASLVEASVKFKDSVVNADLYEIGQRKILNFGHTVGHAFESASLLANAEPWLHGEAVAAGMLVALRLSVRVAGLSPDFAAKWEEFILNNFSIPKTCGMTSMSLMQFLRYDKKNVGNSLRFVLLKEPGMPLFDQEIAAESVREEVELVLSLLS
ncbi:MAG: 3-dehydroquinate synthase [Bacteroidetes bacterium HGW-Bacteroidetes-22]|nr:MAG: 3-dehydroquinate synthase [Bacteroidetes bacterium HGW-Bacteroidetes-22]